ncbi:MAG: mechanosensitive ion channel [Pseudomonadota bacterium]
MLASIKVTRLVFILTAFLCASHLSWSSHDKMMHIMAAHAAADVATDAESSANMDDVIDADLQGDLQGDLEADMLPDDATNNASTADANTTEQAADTDSTEATTADTESSNTNALSQEDWDTLWQSRLQDLYALQQEAQALRMQLPELTDDIEQSVDQGRRAYRHIFALVQAKHTAPNDLVVLDAQLVARITDLETQLLPVKEMVTSLDDRRKELQSIKDDFTENDLSSALVQGSTSQGGTAAGETTEDPIVAAQNATMQNYFAQLTHTQKNASLLHSRLESLLEPGEVLLARMQTLRATVQKNLPTLWRDHYLAPSAMLFDVAAWTEIPHALMSFTQNAVTLLQAELPSSTAVWISCAMRFLFIILPLIGILQTIRKKLQNRFGEESSVTQTFYRIRHGIGWIGFGFALHFASYSSGDDGFRAFMVPANIFLVWGQIALAWSLRTLDNPSFPKRSPFAFFEYLVIISLILLFFNPPLPLLGLTWIASIIVMLVKRHSLTTNNAAPNFEAIMLKVEGIILWVSLITVVLGWGRLAMVIYMAFVALSVSIQLGVALMRIIDSSSEKLPKEGSNAIIGGVLLGLAAPLVLVLVAAAVVLWIIAYPGGAYLLQHAVAFNVKVGAVSFDGLRVLFILTAFYVTRSLTTVGSTFLTQLPHRLPRFDRSMIQPMQAAFTYILWGLFALYALQALGVSLTSLAVIAGGLSVGIGFGMQTIVNNFMSGLILIFGRSLQEGDVVDLGGTVGTVRKVNIRATTVETFDNAVIFVPNSDLVSNQIVNWTRNSRMVRRNINVGVAYGSDVALVKKLLQQVAEEHTNVLMNPAPMVVFNDFGASTLDFILCVWISDISTGIGTMSELRSDIDAIFRENNIEIAFPQMDIHVRSAEGLVGKI